LVIDEADRFSDWESKKSVTSILEVLPKQRRTSLFSATQATYLEDLLKFSLINPIRLNVTSKQALTVNEGLTSNENTSKAKYNVAPARLKNYYMIVAADKKLFALFCFLSDHIHSKVLLFMSNSASVEYFSNVLKKFLPERSISCIHGKMKSKRKKILKEFSDSKKSILLCTDLMARGIDVNDIDWVIQFDFPKISRLFVHRSGRSGRNEKNGQSLVILTDSEAAYMDFIQKHEKIKLHQMDLNELNDLSAKTLKEQIQASAIDDRKILQLGSKAFVSYIQAYSKSDCQYICNLKDLDVVGMADSFGLLRLPKMEELDSRKDIKNFKPRLDVRISSISFKDEKLEQKRQEQLQLMTRKEHQEEAKQKTKTTTKAPKRKNEWDELQMEERMLKKFKKRKNFQKGIGFT